MTKNSKKFSKITQFFFFSLQTIGQMLCLFCLVTPNFLVAQEADDYAFATNTNSSLANLSGATVLLGSGSFMESSQVVPLGFDVWFMGVRYTDFSVNSNGVMQLGKNRINVEANAYNIGSTPRIVPFAAGASNTAMRITDWKVGGQIHYQRQGTSPNRILIVECRNMHVNNDAPDPNATFQIWLYETAPLPATTQGGRIEFRYGMMQCSTDAITGGNRIGFGSSDTRNTFKGVDVTKNPPVAGIGTTDFSSPLPKGIIPALHSPNPNQSRIFSFESPAPDGQAFNLKGSTSAANAIVLTWEENATNEVGYVIYKSKDGRNYEFLTQVNNAKTFTDTEVVPCTNYFYRVYTVTEGKLGVLQPTGSLTYQINQAAALNLEGKFFVCEANPSSSSEITVAKADDFKEIIWATSTGDTLKRGNGFKAAKQGSYVVVGVQKDGCRVSKTFAVTPCCPVLVQIPTAFTPFNTPSNNIFLVKHENTTFFDMKIYNRWGMLVFNSNNPDTGWNGRFYDGTPMQASAYQVIVEYKGCKDGELFREVKREVLYLIE